MNANVWIPQTLFTIVFCFISGAPYIAIADDYVTSPGSHFSIRHPRGPFLGEYIVTEVNGSRIEGFCESPIVNRFVAVDNDGQTTITHKTFDVEKGEFKDGQTHLLKGSFLRPEHLGWCSHTKDPGTLLVFNDQGTESPERLDKLVKSRQAAIETATKAYQGLKNEIDRFESKWGYLSATDVANDGEFRLSWHDFRLEPGADWNYPEIFGDLAQFNHLIDISIHDAKNESDLVGLKKLRRIGELTIAGGKIKGEQLDALANIEELRLLRINNGYSRQSLAAIGQIKNLAGLSLFSAETCPDVRSGDFYALSKLVNLKSATIQTRGGQAASFVSCLTALPHLNTLNVSDDQFKQQLFSSINQIPNLKTLEFSSGTLSPEQLVSITNPSLEVLAAYEPRKLSHETLLAWNVPPNLKLRLWHGKLWTPRGISHFVHELPSMSREERKLYAAIEEFVANINVYLERYGRSGYNEVRSELMDELQLNCRADAANLLKVLRVFWQDKNISQPNALAVYAFLFRFCGRAERIPEFDDCMPPPELARLRRSPAVLKEGFDYARLPDSSCHLIQAEISR